MTGDLQIDLPEQLRPWAWLLGTWEGVGLGQYPTIDDFRFGQQVSFSTDGRPFLTYFSQTWQLDADGERIRPLAVESGFWRPQPDNEVEVLLTHSTGYAEVWLGKMEVTGLVNAEITGAKVELTTDAVLRTESAKDYSGGHRLYGLVDGDLLWTFDMAAMGHELSNHVAIKLSPVGRERTD